MKKATIALAATLLGLVAGARELRGQAAANPAGLLPFMDEGEYWGYMDRTGKVVLPSVYDSARPFSEGIALVWDRGCPVYIDPQGKEIWHLPDILDVGEEELIALETGLGNFREGLACVIVKGMRGFIDRAGKYAIKPQFLWAGGFSEGLAAVKTTEGYGYVRKDGTFAVKPRFDEGRAFQEGLAAVCSGDKFGYIDRTGTVVIKPQFDKVGGFSGGLASFGLRNPGEKKQAGWFGATVDEFNFPGKCGYIDKTGKVVIEAQFEDAGVFSEGLAAIKKGKLWGYIDAAGKVLIEPRFELASLFSEGLAAVFKGGKWGYVDKSGRMAIGFQYDEAYDFVDGLAQVRLGEKIGYILPTGKFFAGPSK